MNITKTISIAALALVILPCLLLFGETLSLATVKTIALVGTVGWFATTPLWIGRSPS